MRSWTKSRIREFENSGIDQGGDLVFLFVDQNLKSFVGK